MKKRSDNIGKKSFHMERNLSNEIIIVLLSEDLHARGLAKRLGENHMTIINKLKELVGANVLDFRTKGKNKVYFLKKTVEAKNYIYMAEFYKLNMTLKRFPELRRIIERVRENPKIKLAVLFGSYAKGTATKSSDIDLFVETRDRRLKDDLELLNSRLSVQIGKYDRSNPLIQEISRDHVIIKGVELFYEKAGFFE